MNFEAAISPEPTKGTILVVDDDPIVVRSLVRSLSKRGYSVETAGSATDAVRRIEAGGLQVVVSDISMPEMSGLELLRRVRENDPDLPVVLITGLPAIESATVAIEYGAFKYLVKPLDVDALRRAVDQAVQLYRLARMKREALSLMGMNAGATDLANLESVFRRALQSVWVAYQPIVRVRDGSVFGYEALLRSTDPTLTGPMEMLSAAERLGELTRLGRLMRRLSSLPMQSVPEGSCLFVNLHPHDLVDPEMVQMDAPLSQIANRVVLEITERAPLHDVEKIRATVAQLRSLGFRIAVDDLGAGYAGLTSFAILEPDVVKLDMALVRAIDKNAVKQKLVESMTKLCKDMGLTIVAEGVETAAERDTLIALGCELLQGNLFALPGPAFPTCTWNLAV